MLFPASGRRPSSQHNLRVRQCQLPPTAHSPPYHLARLQTWTTGIRLQHSEKMWIQSRNKFRDDIALTVQLAKLHISSIYIYMIKGFNNPIFKHFYAVLNAVICCLKMNPRCVFIILFFQCTDTHECRSFFSLHHKEFWQECGAVGVVDT